MNALHAGKNFSRQRLEIFSYFFSSKIGLHISCKLFPKKTICMKCQILFSRKNKKPEMFPMGTNDPPEKNMRKLLAPVVTLYVISTSLRMAGPLNIINSPSAEFAHSMINDNDNKYCE